MTVQTQEFNNDLVSLTVERRPGCTASFDVAITEKGVKEAWKKALKAVNKQVTVPGFRPGKAPDATIEYNYLSFVDKEWKEELMQMAFQNAILLTNIVPLNKESLKAPKIKKFEKNVGAEVTVEFTSYPEIPEIDPKSLEIKLAPPQAIGEREVDDTIEGLLYKKANWTILDKPAIEKGDFVKLTVVNLDDPSQPKICDNMMFEATKEKMGTWLLNAVVGKAVGDQVEAKSQKETNDDTPFVETNCQVTIDSCEKPEVPALDDAFAQGFGCKTVEEFKMRVKEDLENQAKEAVQDENRKRAAEALCEAYSFEVPESLFQQERKARLDSINKQMKEMTPEEKQEFEQGFSEEGFSKGVKDVLRMLFFTHSLVKQFNIDITEWDCMQELSALYSRRDPVVQHWMANYDKETMLNELTNRLRRKKVLDEIIHQNQI